MYETTGFICSKKDKVEDPFIPSLASVIEDLPSADPSLRVTLFLGALTYPYDSKRNISGLANPHETKRVLDQIQKVHDCLYKYSHQKLDSFCSTPELAFLYVHFYDNCPNAIEGFGFPEILAHIDRRCRLTLK
jgi:hypothetical protein